MSKETTPKGLPAPVTLTLEQAKQVGGGISPSSVIKYIGGYLAGLAAR